MSELTTETRSLIERAREERLPDEARLAPIGRDIEAKLEEIESRSAPLLPRRTLFFAAVGVCLLLTSSVAAYGIASGMITIPVFSEERNEEGVAGVEGEEEPPVAQPVVSRRPSRAPRVDVEPPEEPAEQPPLEDVNAGAPERAPGTPTAVGATPSFVRLRPRHAVAPESPAPDEADVMELVPETLAAETQLITQAQSALRQRQPREALRSLDEHRRRFPNGTLSVDREAARLVARCQINPSESLREGARRFVEQHPGSIYTARIRADCLQ